MPDENSKPVEQPAPPVEQPKPVEKTPAQIAAEKRTAEIKAQQEAERAERAALKVKRDTLKLNIGKSFTDGERDATVQGFYPDKLLGSVQADAFLVNFGNPCRSDFVPCGTFLETFKGKE